MTEATQTTFFSDFFGKEMSENSDLVNQAKPLGVSFGIIWVSDANGVKSPTASFLVWAPPSSYFFFHKSTDGGSYFFPNDLRCGFRKLKERGVGNRTSGAVLVPKSLLLLLLLYQMRSRVLHEQGCYVRLREAV